MYLCSKGNLWQENGQVPLNSVLFPISTYLLNVLKKIKIDLSEGSWWFSYEMRQLRLRSNIHALYLYDLQTEEHMILYRKGTVSIADQYSLATTIDNRYQGDQGIKSHSRYFSAGFKFGFSSKNQIISTCLSLKQSFSVLTRSCNGKNIDDNFKF